MDTLIVGPWVGEFGWELLSWQGWVRVVAKNYKHVVVSAPRGHEVLYEMATVLIPHSLGGTKDCWRGLSLDTFELSKVEKRLSAYKGDRLRPASYVHPDMQKFVRLGNAANVPVERQYDVLIHARRPIGKRSYHAWKAKDAAAVAKSLGSLRVGCIGTSSEAYEVDEADDLRDYPLNTLCDLIAAARLVISPASGPALLSGLCGTPFLCWTDGGYRSAVKENDDRRVRDSWNPLKTPCRVLVKQDWKPDPGLLVKYAEEMLTSGKREIHASGL